MRSLIVATIAFSATTARAEELIPERDWYPRVTVGVGAGGYLGDVAALHPSGTTLMLNGEVRVSSLTFLRATLEHAWLEAKDKILVAPIKAEVDAYSLVVRHALFSFGAKGVRIGGDLYVTGGINREHLHWDAGERLRRTQAVMGFGGSVVIYNRSYKPHSIITYGMRVNISRAPDAGKLPFGCDGPCDMATKTKPFDHSMIMEIAWHYGR